MYIYIYIQICVYISLSLYIYIYIYIYMRQTRPPPHRSFLHERDSVGGLLRQGAARASAKRGCGAEGSIFPSIRTSVHSSVIHCMTTYYGRHGHTIRPFISNYTKPYCGHHVHTSCTQGRLHLLHVGDDGYAESSTSEANGRPRGCSGVGLRWMLMSNHGLPQGG